MIGISIVLWICQATIWIGSWGTHVSPGILVSWLRFLGPVEKTGQVPVVKINFNWSVNNPHTRGFRMFRSYRFVFQNDLHVTNQSNQGTRPRMGCVVPWKRWRHAAGGCTDMGPGLGQWGLGHALLEEEPAEESVAGRIGTHRSFQNSPDFLADHQIWSWCQPVVY